MAADLDRSQAERTKDVGDMGERKRRYLRRAKALGRRKSYGVDTVARSREEMEYVRVPAGSPVLGAHVTLPHPLLQSTPNHSDSSLENYHTQLRSSAIISKNTSVRSQTENHSVPTQLENKLNHLADMNRELKRLLVASIGNSLQEEVEQVLQDKIQLAHDLDASVTKITEYHEELDELVVECDVWRSKFLASRVLIEELSTWRNTLLSRYNACHGALVKLLEERTTLCRDMAQCQESLRQALYLIGEADELKERSRGPSDHRGTKVATVSPIQLSEKAAMNHHRTTLDIAQDTRDTARCVLERAQSLMSQTSRSGMRTEKELKQKPTASVPTAGERLAHEVLQQGLHSAQPPTNPPSFPHLSYSEQHLLLQRRPDTSSSSISYMPSVLMTRDLLNPPFHCACCRGKIMII